MEAEAKRAENRAGISDLAAGYPPPKMQAGLDVRDDDGDVGGSTSEAELGDFAMEQAGGDGDDGEPATEFGPMQARSAHRTLHVRTGRDRGEGQEAAETDLDLRGQLEGSLSDDISVDEYKSVFDALELRFGMQKVPNPTLSTQPVVSGNHFNPLFLRCHF